MKTASGICDIGPIMHQNESEDMADPALSGLSITFGDRFMQDHAGAILNDSRVAMIELIANAYDAGATRVEVTWPSKADEVIAIRDNGTGMTREQFFRRWTQLNYNRLVEQTLIVAFPDDVVDPPRRRAFGRNGKGRHAGFCFADEYLIQTASGGERTAARIVLDSASEQPYRVEEAEASINVEHGTWIEATARRNLIGMRVIRDAVGGKFLVDPRFEISFNGEVVELESLGAKTSHTLVLPDGVVLVHAIDGQASDRTTKLRGITYWVNGRMVGEPDWDGLDSAGAILDGRSAAAKRYSFVVEADCLEGHVRPDWRGFNVTESARRVTTAVREEIVRLLEGFLRETTKERKIAAIIASGAEIKDMTPLSKKAVGEFIDAIQQKCPTLSEEVLTRTIEVFAKMENARTGHSLMAELASCSSDDIDRWYEIVSRWTAQDAKFVLDELGRRLTVIVHLEKLVNDKTTDELHDLQPLFERGLWIFGPEYERVDYRANRTLATIIRELLGGSDDSVGVSRRRPDFVALPDRSIGIYSADAWDRNGEASGIDRVMIVELKRGGAEINTGNLRQGEDYALALRAGNRVGPDAKISVFVLGSTLAPDSTEQRGVGANITITPLIYDHFLRRAHQRTFNLLEKLTESTKDLFHDPEMQDAFAQAELPLDGKG